MPARIIDQDIRRISRLAARILGLISTVEQVPRPTLYQQVMRGVSEMLQIWRDHLEILSAVLAEASVKDPAQAPWCQEVEKGARIIGQRLEALSAAGWPRDSRIGLSSIHVRVREILGTILKLMDSERTTLLPLLERPNAAENSSKRASIGS
jgi:hypothetical protein